MISFAPLLGLAKTALTAMAPIAIAKTINNYSHRRDNGEDVGESIVGACVDTGCQCLSAVSGIPLEDEEPVTRRRIEYNVQPSVSSYSSSSQLPTVVAFSYPEDYKRQMPEPPYTRVIVPS